MNKWIYMDKLYYDIIYIIKELLDPVSYISFLETGSNIINHNDYNGEQYKRKQIEYFQLDHIKIHYSLNFSLNFDHKQFIVTDKTIFLSISNEKKKRFDLVEEGDYVLIGKRTKPMKLNIKGNNIHVNLNKKIIEAMPNNNAITVSGEHNSLHNGFVTGYETTLVDIRSHYSLLYNIDATLYIDKNRDKYQHIAGIYARNCHNVLIHTCNCRIEYQSYINFKEMKIEMKIEKKIEKKIDPKIWKKQKHFNNNNKCFRKIRTFNSRNNRLR